MVEINPDDAYGDERSRVYKAALGSKRVPMLLFVPHPGKAEFDRLFPYMHIQYAEVRKDGTEIYIELPYMTIVLTGRNLRSVALCIGQHACSRVVAFSPAHHDWEESVDAPLIEAIEYKKMKVAASANEQKPPAVPDEGKLKNESHRHVEKTLEET
jgi:hypothetical protein